MCVLRRNNSATHLVFALVESSGKVKHLIWDSVAYPNNLYAQQPKAQQ